jgi:hypothetical protein
LKFRLKVFGDRMEWIIKARGNPNITAKHRTTFMLTTDRWIGPRGDCVVGIEAERSAADLDPDLKLALRSGNDVLITLSAGGIREKISAKGHPSLPLNHPRDLVVRKSDFICGRTIAISADKAAADFSRKFVEVLSKSSTIIRMELRVSP